MAQPAAAAASELPPAASTPDALLVRLYYTDVEAAPDPQLVVDCTLADVLDERDVAREHNNPLISTAPRGATAPMQPLRDVLLRRAALPGHGLLREEWVSDALRERVTLEVRLLGATDAVAVAHVLAQAATPHEAAMSLACAQISDFACDAQRRSAACAQVANRVALDVQRCSAASAAAAHAVALRALSEAAGPARDAAAALLVALAYCTDAGVWQPSIEPLVPLVLAELAADTASFSFPENSWASPPPIAPRRPVQLVRAFHGDNTDMCTKQIWHVSWLHRAVELTRYEAPG